MRKPFPISKLAVSGGSRLLERTQRSIKHVQKMITIVSWCPRGDAELASSFEMDMARFSSTHGSDTVHLAIYREQGSRRYSKTTALQEAAQRWPSAQWLWWLDCDTLMLNQSATARSILDTALDLAGVGACAPQLILSYETWGSVGRQPNDSRPINRCAATFLHRSHVCTGLLIYLRTVYLSPAVSSGSFFLRNNAWGAHFLHTWTRQCALVAARFRGTNPNVVQGTARAATRIVVLAAAAACGLRPGAPKR